LTSQIFTNKHVFVNIRELTVEASLGTVAIMVKLHVPLTDNQGKAFEAARFNAYESILVDVLGGFTKLPGEYAGAWEYEGRRFDDKSVVYTVIINSLIDGGRVGTAARDAMSRFEQLAILIRYLGLAEIIE